MNDLTRRGLLKGLVAGAAAAATPTILVPEIIKDLDPDEIAYYSRPRVLRPRSFSGWLRDAFKKPLFDPSQGKAETSLLNWFGTIEISGHVYKVYGGRYDINRDLVILGKNEPINMLDVNTGFTVRTTGTVLAESITGFRVAEEMSRFKYSEIFITGDYLRRRYDRHPTQTFFHTNGPNHFRTAPARAMGTSASDGALSTRYVGVGIRSDTNGDGTHDVQIMEVK